MIRYTGDNDFDDVMLVKVLIFIFHNLAQFSISDESSDFEYFEISRLDIINPSESNMQPQPFGSDSSGIRMTKSIRHSWG